jgi:hypothetical protein
VDQEPSTDVIANGFELWRTLSYMDQSAPIHVGVQRAIRRDFNECNRRTLSSDDKIVGEVRNIVFGTKDRRDYAIVASGGFFTPGKDSIVVPIWFLKVSQDRGSFFLSMPEAEVKAVPLMPDQDYKWLSDEAWRTRNDALFTRP